MDIVLENEKKSLPGVDETEPGDREEAGSKTPSW